MLTAKAPVLHWVIGECPDVLAYDDKGAHRLYVAIEIGTLSMLDLHDYTLVVTGTGHLADNAHVGGRRSTHPPQLLAGPGEP